MVVRWWSEVNRRYAFSSSLTDVIMISKENAEKLNAYLHEPTESALPILQPHHAAYLYTIT